MLIHYLFIWLCGPFVIYDCYNFCNWYICISSEIKPQLLNIQALKDKLRQNAILQRKAENRLRETSHTKTHLRTIQERNYEASQYLKCNNLLYFLRNKRIYSIRVFNNTYLIFFYSGSFLFNLLWKRSQKLLLYALQCFKAINGLYFLLSIAVNKLFSSPTAQMLYKWIYLTVCLQAADYFR